MGNSSFYLQGALWLLVVSRLWVKILASMLSSMSHPPSTIYVTDLGLPLSPLAAVGLSVNRRNSNSLLTTWIIDYGPRIYTSLGIADNKLLLLNGIYGVIGPITNFFFITLLLDRVGRVKPLYMGSIGICIVLSIECALNATYPPSDIPGETNLTAQRGSIAMFFLSSIIFSVSYGPGRLEFMRSHHPTYNFFPS